jgi:MFS transporter, FSR family, fosmidomycin resistance protein
MWIRASENQEDQKMENKTKELASNRILYVVSLNHFINDSSTYLISSLFPAAELVFGFSTFEIGILVAVGYLVNMIFQPLTGRFSERFEARKLLALGISLIAISMLLFTISSILALMLVSILILRFGSSFFHPVGVSAISKSYPVNRLDSAMGFLSAFGNLGIVLAFVFSVPIYQSLGWSAPFLIYASLGVATVIITLSLMSRRKDNLTTITTIVPDIDKDSRESFSDQPTSLTQENNTKATGSPRRKHRFGLPIFFILTMFAAGGTYAIFGNFGNLLLVHNGLGLSFSNYLMAIWVISAFVGAIVTGRLTERLSRSKLLIIAFCLAAVASFVFAFSLENVFLVIFSLVINGFTLSITYPSIYSELSAYLGESSKKKGASFGILFSSQIAGSSVLGFVGGYIAGVFGLQLLFEITGLLLFGSVGLVLMWFKGQNSSLDAVSLVKDMV